MSSRLLNTCSAIRKMSFLGETMIFSTASFSAIAFGLTDFIEMRELLLFPT